MKTKLTLTLVTLVGLIAFAGYARGRSSNAAFVDDNTNPHYKGGSTFNLSGAAPNVARCGPFPENVELSFTGGGTDTEGGVNTAVFSACSNTTTNLVSKLQAVDTYVATGDQVFIEGDDFVLVPNFSNCVATNAHGVPFRITGGTGGHAGATGQGRFHITTNLTPCNGLVQPSQVWFEGAISVHQN